MGDLTTAVVTLVGGVEDEPWVGLIGLGLALVALRLLGRRRGPVCRPGEVWFALVPFEDGTGAKDRPVLVLAASPRTCTVARLTSHDSGRRPDFVPVPEGVPGLARASWISLRETRLHRAALRRRIGDPGEAFVAWYRDARAASGRSRPDVSPQGQTAGTG